MATVAGVIVFSFEKIREKESFLEQTPEEIENLVQVLIVESDRKANFSFPKGKKEKTDASIFFVS